MSLDRKRFLQQMAVLAVGTALPLDTLAKGLQNNSAQSLLKSKAPLDLLVLHTNDLHSRIEPFPSNHPMAGKGGIANLATLIQEHRKNHPHVLLLDCGDVFQGTPYFNLFGGQVEYQWMQNMGYHATTMGNHDFDNGIEHLANMLEKNPAISMLNCNYELAKTRLKEFVKPYRIVEIGGKTIGITGVGISPENLILERMIPGLKYNDPVVEVQKTVDYLRNQAHCDAVFVISHLGYSYDTDKIDDLKLAAKTHGITAIVGGHTHTFLEKATEVINAKGQTVLVNQAGWGGLMLGQLRFSL
jgi:5'-nucleotidase